ncbi:MAG: GtrA family protein [Gammaproteobacteria bacterium]|nr:MAG: GtrA family protein [Gammaproteobacteria bacterium]
MRSFWYFCIGGVIGFLVDYGVLLLLVAGFAQDRFSARIVSFLCAATATWIFNRTYTFRGHARHSLFGEWARYLLAMSGGFGCNYAAYTAMVLTFDLDKQWLGIAVAAGSVAGLGVNYLASRYWIYRKTHPAVAPSPAASGEQ